MTLSKGCSTALQSSPPEPEAEASRPTILIVDDAKEITTSLADQFQRKFKVLTAANGREALAILQEHSVAVIIADQRMPGMTGADLLARSLTIDSDAVRILLTGYSDINTVIESVNEGKIFFYLAKPWNSVELEVVVTKAVKYNRLLRERSQAAEKLREANAGLEAMIVGLKFRRVLVDELHAANAGLEERVAFLIRKLEAKQAELEAAHRRIADLEGNAT